MTKEMRKLVEEVSNAHSELYLKHLKKIMRDTKRIVEPNSDALDLPVLVVCPFCNSLLTLSMRSILFNHQHYCDCSDMQFTIKMKIEVSSA